MKSFLYRQMKPFFVPPKVIDVDYHEVEKLTKVNYVLHFGKILPFHVAHLNELLEQEEALANEADIQND